MARHVPERFWSSCCGATADYIGYYRCTGCRKPLHMGRARPPHLIGDPREADRIRQRLAEPELTPEGRLF